MMVGICIDGDKMDRAQHRRYRGAGMVSGNNSSRLLLDYRQEHPKEYWEILEHIFGDRGVGVTHLKLEMGSDINSSSGTEPGVKRSALEAADVTRGAGYRLAADAKKVNPDLTLDMLWWSEPAWVAAAEDVYDARYRWYRETLEAAYREYGLMFDYVSASQNEREIDFAWIKYLARRMKEERNGPYDYGKVKIVASDEDNQWRIADAMLADQELRDAVDVVGTHYTSFASEAAKRLSEEYGKEIWMSEASAPMCFSRGRHPKTGRGIEMAGINGVLDIASRIIGMISQGNMTLYEYQPVVSAYYDGVSYCEKQLIAANEPWSGKYSLESGYYMALHFSQFIRKGWHFLPEACCCDGKKGGDGHAMVDVQKCYLSAMDGETGDFATVIANPTGEKIAFEFNVKNTERAFAPIMVWETRTSERGEAFGANYFRHVGTDTHHESRKGIAEGDIGKGGEMIASTVHAGGDARSFIVEVGPESLATVSTVVVQEEAYCRPASEGKESLALPYYDDFTYEELGRDYLTQRGFAPRYMTDQGGAFEVVEVPGEGRALCQKITPDLRAAEWGATPEPTTNFGDDRWFNYSISAEVAFGRDCLGGKESARESQPGNASGGTGQVEDAWTGEEYAGIGLRYRMAAQGASGYRLLLFSNGVWRLLLDDILLEAGEAKDAKPSVAHEGIVDKEDCKRACGQIQGGRMAGWHTLRLEAVENTVSAYLDGILLTSRECQREEWQGAGRGALYSSYNGNLFRNLGISPVEGEKVGIERWDDMEGFIRYEGDWDHQTIGSFQNYRRTLSVGKMGAGMKFSFQGMGFAITGDPGRKGSIRVMIDGEVEEEDLGVFQRRLRGISYCKYGLKEGRHEVEVRVLSGTYGVDSVEAL